MSNFFLKTMLRSYRRSWETMLLADPYYYKHYTQIFESIIKQSKMAVAKDDTGMIMAFMFYEPKDLTLHFVYVRNSHRASGAGKTLIKPLVQDGTINTSFITKDFKNFIGKRTKINYEPFRRYYV